MPVTIGRNDPCHCGSGKKYKKCHLEKDEAAGRKEREKAALNATEVAKENEEKKPIQGQVKPKPEHGHGGWMKKVSGQVGSFRRFLQRRSPSANKGG